MSHSSRMRVLMETLSSLQEQVVMESMPDALEDLKLELPNSSDIPATLASIASDYGLDPAKLQNEFERLYGPMAQFGEMKSRQDAVAKLARQKEDDQKALQAKAEQEKEAKKRAALDARSKKKPNMTSKLFGVRFCDPSNPSFGDPSDDFITWAEMDTMVDDIRAFIVHYETSDPESLIRHSDLDGIIHSVLIKRVPRKERWMDPSYRTNVDTYLERMYKKKYGTSIHSDLMNAQQNEYDFHDDNVQSELPKDLRQLLAVLFAWSNLGLYNGKPTVEGNIVYLEPNGTMSITMRPGKMSGYAQELAWSILNRYGGDLTARIFMSEINQWAKDTLPKMTVAEIEDTWPWIKPVIDAYLVAKLTP